MPYTLDPPENFAGFGNRPLGGRNDADRRRAAWGGLCVNGDGRSDCKDAGNHDAYG